jgi:hypothetical protein
MTAHHLVALGPEEVIRALPDLADLADVRFGPPRAVDSYADAVEAPLGPEEVKQIVEAVNLAVQSVAHLTLVILAIRKLLSHRPGQEKVVVKDARTGREVLVIDSDTDSEEAARKILEEVK